MDMARPEGLVIDGEYGLDRVPDELSALFDEDAVCLRSVAEQEPRKIHVLRDRVIIPTEARRPFGEARWEEISHRYATFQAFRDSGERFQFQFPKPLAESGECQVLLVHPAVGPGGRRHPDGLVTNKRVADTHFYFNQEGPDRKLGIHFAAIADELREAGVRRNWGPLTLRILYRVA
jgi:hypothetical protein